MSRLSLAPSPDRQIRRLTPVSSIAAMMILVPFARRPSLFRSGMPSAHTTTSWPSIARLTATGSSTSPWTTRMFSWGLSNFPGDLANAVTL